MKPTVLHPLSIAAVPEYRSANRKLVDTPAQNAPLRTLRLAFFTEIHRLLSRGGVVR